jgi:hypothetical protein
MGFFREVGISGFWGKMGEKREMGEPMVVCGGGDVPW